LALEFPYRPELG